MRLINKRNKKNRKKGHAIVGMFLRRGWDKESGRYINCSYSDLLSEGKLTRLLLREQDYLCCYCMRTISFKNHTTLEHVMPRKTKITDHNTISHYLNVARFMKRYVRCTQEPPSRRVIFPPYPHYCAYENLVASCDGSICDINNNLVSYPGRLHNCCNNKRGNKVIIPLFYLRGVDEIIRYERDGSLTYDEKYKDTIKAINLEFGTLKTIRKAWARVCNYYTIEDVRRAMSDKTLRYEIVDDADLSVNESSFISRDDIWNVFYEYRWFFDYFRKKKRK